MTVVVDLQVPLLANQEAWAGHQAVVGDILPVVVEGSLLGVEGSLLVVEGTQHLVEVGIHQVAGSKVLTQKRESLYLIRIYHH